MPIEDTFPYTARFDSVGLDCSHCTHEQIGSGFPNLKRDYCCRLHGISLAIELQDNGYKLWEWFCKDFESDGSAHPPAVDHFNGTKEKLESEILYRLYGEDGYLKEFPFDGLEKCETESAS